jgi:hypothetical protein
MEWLSLAIALVGAGVAVFVPLAVEYSRRPELAVERADDVNVEERTPRQRIVHVRVINRSLEGWRSRWLLRNVATGCTVRVKFISRSDRTGAEFNGRWSGHPEPYTFTTIHNTTGTVGLTVNALIVDPTKIPQTRVMDVSPGKEGQVVGIAIKTEGHDEAYGFGPESYLYETSHLQNPEWELPHELYEVEVVAEAGGLASAPARFLLRNEGNSYRGLSLEPVSGV